MSNTATATQGHESTARSDAVQALFQVMWRGKASDEVLDEIDPNTRPYVHAVLFATLRNAFTLGAIVGQYCRSDTFGMVQAVLLIGSCELLILQKPAHAVVNEAVENAKRLKLDNFQSLINAVMRKIATLDARALDEARGRHRSAAYELPNWMIKRMTPAQLEFHQFQRTHSVPAMWLRLQPKQNLSAYAEQLLNAEITFQTVPELPNAIRLETPVSVSKLPFFADGALSVQDGAAQLAAHLLAPTGRERVLDACAAPGGKTAHLAALAPQSEIIAVDSDGARLKRVEETFTRLKLKPPSMVAGDAANLPKSLGRFDKILLDAPCSATGVIRRHPDIAHLRRESDLSKLTAIQANLLRCLWGKLNPGGRLLYATCSVLYEENAGQIKSFLSKTPDAALIAWPEAFSWFGHDTGFGRQNWPWQNACDGFFYALLEKT